MTTDFRPRRIDETEVSSLEEDLLNFDKDIAGVKKLLLNIEPKFVISVEAPWGSGKSTFLRILENDLKNDHSVIKINVWENDYSDNPIAAILTGLLSSDLYEKNSDTIDQIFKTGLKFSKNLLPVLVKVLTSGLLDTQGIKNFNFDEFMEEASLTIVEDFKKQESALVELKDSLKTLVDKSKSKKLFILVDELDRCRPDYSLEFLESIKHLFNVDGVVFVLAVEGKVLGAQMKQVYGESFDSDEYLKKFIDIRFRLEPRITLKFIEHRFEEFGVNSLMEGKDYWSPKSNGTTYVTLTYYMTVLYNLRPRDVNQIITKYLLLLVSRDWNKVSPFIVLFLLILDQNSKESVHYFIKADSIQKIYNGDGSSGLFIPFKEWFDQKNLSYLNDNKDDLPYIIAILLDAKRGGLNEEVKEYRKLFSNTEQSDTTKTSHTQKWEDLIGNEIDRQKMGHLGKKLLDDAIEYINFTEH